MKKRTGKRAEPGRVSEPVQVYLDLADRERLALLAERLDATKSDVLRRGLVALEAQLRRPAGKAGTRGPLPTFKGGGVLPGVDLSNSAGLLDVMEAPDVDG